MSVRVRFAPSPTGYLHMGGARTALFNWLFARHEGGRFILRIEDTDVARSTRELEAGLLEDLKWLGLEWDEGPDVGGEYGPYRQSERLDIYRKYVDELVSSGKAYPCFCTDEELERKRKEMLKAGKPPHYDGTCRNLTPSEIEERRREGRPESIRFRVDEGVSKKLHDLIRGEVNFPAGMVGDFVILRSNGLPTYNFAATIDDHLMRITHVIRGEEHLSNTLRQLFIYEALGFEIPEFAHIPLILGKDRTKLSKRHGAPNIKDFREMGYPREGIVNYLAFLGWSPSEEKEILAVDELITLFSLEHVSKSPSIFDEVKLNWVCSQHVRAGGSDRYFDEALRFFPEVFKEHYSRDILREIFDIVSENLPYFNKIEEEAVSFAPGPPTISEEALKWINGRAALFQALIEKLGSLQQFNAQSIKGALKEAGAQAGVKGKELFMPLRVAVTGLEHGPDIGAVLRIRGREDVIVSLKKALELARKKSN